MIQTMAWSVADAARASWHPKPPRHNISPEFLTRALGLEGKPRWVFREGVYKLGPFGFPPAILDLPIERAVELAKKLLLRQAHLE